MGRCKIVYRLVPIDIIVFSWLEFKKIWPTKKEKKKKCCLQQNIMEVFSSQFNCRIPIARPKIYYNLIAFYSSRTHIYLYICRNRFFKKRDWRINNQEMTASGITFFPVSTNYKVLVADNIAIHASQPHCNHDHHHQHVKTPSVTKVGFVYHFLPPRFLAGVFEPPFRALLPFCTFVFLKKKRHINDKE